MTYAGQIYTFQVAVKAFRGISSDVHVRYRFEQVSATILVLNTDIHHLIHEFTATREARQAVAGTGTSKRDELFWDHHAIRLHTGTGISVVFRGLYREICCSPS